MTRAGRGAARQALLDRIISEWSVAPGPVSLRGLASTLRVSHRTILHHFGSKAGLVEAVADELAAEQGRALDLLTDAHVTALERLEATWQALVSYAEAHGALYFQLASHLMHRTSCAPTDVAMRDAQRWLDALERTWTEAGISSDAAPAHARLDLAMVRGALHDLLLTRDREEVEAAMRRFLTLSRVVPHA